MTMLGLEVLFSQTILGITQAKFRGLNEVTKRFVQKMEERYGAAELIGKGFVLNFGKQIV